MKREDYRPLGEYIQIVDERNRDGAINNLVGVSFEKKIIPSIANTIGTDLSNYRIIKPGQFAYCPVTSRNGDRISIALYKGNDNAILSVAYSVFEIIKPGELNSDYLMLWVSRPEFDRYARFMSHGSVRELFSWEDMCNVMLPVPAIEEQRRIVAEYQTVERRIKNNEALIQKLEETAQAIYHHTFVEGIDENNLPKGWKKSKLIDFISIRGGGTPSTDIGSYWINGSIPFFSPKDATNNLFTFITEKKITEEGLNNCSSSLFAKYTIFLTARGTIGKIAIAGYPMAMNQSNFALTGKENVTQFYLYYLLKQYIEKIKGGANGAVFSSITMNEFYEEVLVAPKESINDFTEKVSIILNVIENYSRELHHLRKLQSLLTSKLA